MYVTARRVQESLLLFAGEETIQVKVLSITGNIVRLGVNAGPQTGIYREEECGQAEAEAGTVEEGTKTQTE